MASNPETQHTWSVWAGFWLEPPPRVPGGKLFHCRLQERSEMPEVSEDAQEWSWVSLD